MVSPNEILNKVNGKKGFKPTSSKKGLSSMFSPVYVENKKENTKPKKKSPKKIETKKEKSEKSPLSVEESGKPILKVEESLSLPQFEFGSTKISLEDFSTVLDLTGRLYSHDLKLFTALLIKSEFGRFKNICIEESDYQKYGLRKGKAIKDSRENLEQLGLIECIEAYKSEKAGRKTYFFTIISFSL